MTPPGPPEALLREAARLRQSGRVTEAVAAYRRLLAAAPDLPDSWYNLARLLRQAGRYEEALAAYGEALARGAGRPEEIHLNRGVIYADHLRRDDAAEAELRAALTRDPDYVPALLNLGNLMEDRGERAAALAHYERALALDPGCYDALARIGGLAGVGGADDPLIARIARALVLPGAAPAQKAGLGFALGRLLDACGAYDRAFAAYAEANRLSRASAPPGTARYDRRAQERLVDRIVQVFTPERAAALASAPELKPPGAPPPLFVCGMFRSGSTLTEQVLASHPDVAAGGELELLPALVKGPLAPYPASLATLAPARLAPHAAAYRARLKTLFPDAKRVTDKRPDNFLYIGLIKALFPDARIVHTVRDALDNCLSVFFLHLDPGMGYALDLMDIGHYWRQYRRLMAHWKRLYGADILDFDYDAFVRHPRPAAERLLAFAGLEWNEACLDFHRTRNAVKTASVWQVREPLYTRASGRAGHYAKHLEALKAYLEDPAP